MAEERQQNEGTENEERKTEGGKTAEVHTEKTTTTQQGGGEPQTTHTEKTTRSGERDSGG